MDKAIYIAMTGGKHINRAQAIHANNLANANTDGFRADFAQARAMGVYYGDGHPTRAYALSESPAVDFNPGTLRQTGRDLDIAIAGDGWIAVQGFDGSEAYTRAGSLQVDALGQLLTAEGLPVLGEGGPVAIPPFDKLEIGDDGTINIQPQGQGVDILAEVGRIRLVNPNLQDLVKGEDGLLRHRDGAEVVADAGVRLQTGFLESSNVSAVHEMTEIISLARQFELQVKMMRTVEDNTRAASQLLRVS